MNISDAKAAVDREWDKFEKLPGWQATNVKSKNEVIEKKKLKKAVSTNNFATQQFRNTKVVRLWLVRCVSGIRVRWHHK